MICISNSFASVAKNCKFHCEQGRVIALSNDSVFNNVNFTSLFAMELTVFATLANELPMHIKHYKQLNKNELWKTVSRTSFQKQNFSRFYNNLLQDCPSAPSFVYAVLHIPSFTVDRLFLFPHTDKFRDTAPLQPKVTKEVSRTVVTLEN